MMDEFQEKMNQTHRDMGVVGRSSTKKFTQKDVNNRSLVIKMLKYEDSIVFSKEGQDRFRNILNAPRSSTENMHAFHRMTLHNFGFTTEDDDVRNYRSIFKHYFKSPDVYDKEVVDSVHYMRENRCVFYKSEPLNVGDTAPNCRLFHLDGTTKTTLHDQLNQDGGMTMVCAFSNS